MIKLLILIICLTNGFNKIHTQSDDNDDLWNPESMVISNGDLDDDKQNSKMDRDHNDHDVNKNYTSVMELISSKLLVNSSTTSVDDNTNVLDTTIQIITNKLSADDNSSVQAQQPPSLADDDLLLMDDSRRTRRLIVNSQVRGDGIPIEDDDLVNYRHSNGKTDDGDDADDGSGDSEINISADHPPLKFVNRTDNENMEKAIDDDLELIDGSNDIDLGNSNNIPNNGPKPGQRSLVIVFDATASMTDDLAQLRSGAEYLVEKLSERKSNPIYNYVLVPFRDPEVGPKLVTTNPNELLNKMKHIEIRGGGDCPEAALEGLTMALESALPQSFVYVFTDAVARDYYLYDSVLKLVQQKQTTITFFITGYCKMENSTNHKVFEKIAAASNGQIFDIRKHDIREVVQSVESMLDINHTPIKYIESKTKNNHIIDLDVDRNLNEFTVSVAGNRPNIEVTNPNNEIVRNATNIINLDNLRVIKIPQPDPGKWQINATSDSGHSIRLSGITKVGFNFGFSTAEPHQIDELIYRPLQDVDNLLSIIPSDPRLINDISNVEISMFDDTGKEDPFKFKLNLKKIQVDGHDVWVTIPFKPPRLLFKIQINGFDDAGNPFERLITTAIKSSVDEAPDVSVDQELFELNEGETLILKCNVHSFTNVLGAWKKGPQTIYDMVKENSFELLHMIPTVDVSDTGDYKCQANNSVGHASKTVRVKVNEQKLNVLTPVKSVAALEGQDVILQCNVQPETDILVYWQFNGNEIDPELFEIIGSNIRLKKLLRNMSGRYECFAERQRQSKSDSLQLAVNFGPELYDINEETIELYYGDSKQLTCDSDGNPKPTTSWNLRREYDPAINVLTNSETLNILEMSVMDEGTYTCEISNDVGPTQIRTIRLEGKAIDPPEIQQTVNPIIVVNENDDLELSCECHNCLPLLKYQWIHNETTYSKCLDNGTDNLSFSEKISYGYSHSELVKKFTYKINITNIRRDQQGIFNCHIQNEHGTDDIFFDVKVLPQKNLVKIGDNEKMAIKEGNNAYFKCETSGNTSVVHWMKDGEAIISNDDRKTIQNESLVLYDIRRSDAGVYSCSAINSLGVVVRNFTLLVVVPSSQKIQGAIAGQKVILPCQMYELNPRAITWLLNGHEIPEEKRTKFQQIENALIFNADASDTGIYECRALNTTGDVESHEMVLVIYAAPSIYPQQNEVIKVTSNSDLTLECIASGVPSPEFKWTHDGDSVLNNSSDLVLHKVTTAHQGSYVCDAVNGIGMAQKVFFVIVNDPPKIISDIPKNITLTDGNVTTIECDAIGNPSPKIYWTYLNETFAMKTLTIGEDIHKFGLYTCVAENAEGIEVRNLEVKIVVRPRVKRTESKIETGLRETITLHCPIEGADVLNWLKDGHPINFDLSKSFSVSDQVDLKIASVSSHHQGNYTCIGLNEAGNASFTFELETLHPPYEINMHTGNDTATFNEQEVPEIELGLGKKLSLMCTANGNPAPQIEWTKNSKSITNTSVLEIESVNLTHSGIYSCTAKNIYGQSSKSYRLIVTAPPLYKGEERENYIQVNHGHFLRLNCEMFGYPFPTITWYKDDALLTEFQEVLENPHATVDDAGLYKCVAENDHGEAEVEFRVDVFDEPAIVHITPPIITMKSEPFNFTCTATGIPIPILSWVFNGHVMVTNSHIHFDDNLNGQPIIYIDSKGNGISVNNSPFDSTIKRLKHFTYYGIFRKGLANEVSLDIVVPKSKLELSGKYECIAMSSQGRDLKSTSADVMMAPHTAKRDKTGLVETLVGLPIVITCPFVGHPPPEIEWLKNDKYFEVEDDNIKIQHGGKYLTIIEANRGHEGTYKCLATNKVGEDSLEFEVKIYSPPTLKTTNPSAILSNLSVNDEFTVDTPYDKVTLKRDEDLDLICSVDGAPEPEIFWLQLNVHDHNDKTIIAKSRQLFIPYIQESAIYLCSANNSYGVFEKLYHVTVESAPEIEEYHDENIVARIYQGFTLKCSMSGEPKPEVTWAKDGQVLTYSGDADDKHVFISTDGQLLRVGSSMEGDGGEYTCTGSNKLGMVKKVFDVEITVQVEYSPWGPWSECSATCGKGIRKRFRMCLLPNGKAADETKGQRCVGQDSQIQGCEISPCPVNGGWGDWSFWTACTSKCVSEDGVIDSVRRRYRKCDSPTPERGGNPCIGASTQVENCAKPFCPVDGGWSEFDEWSQCSVTCGNGYSKRVRTCTKPYPKYGGVACDGNEVEVKVCHVGKCPVDGGWSNWSPWSSCSASCDQGRKTRVRTCNNPEPEFGGRKCLGNNFEIEACLIKKCEDLKPVISHRDGGSRSGGTSSSQLFTPYIEINHHSDYDSDEYDYEMDSSKGYSEAAPIEYVLPQNYNNRLSATVHVQNTIILDKDVVHYELRPTNNKRSGGGGGGGGSTLMRNKRKTNKNKIKRICNNLSGSSDSSSC